MKGTNSDPSTFPMTGPVFELYFNHAIKKKIELNIKPTTTQLQKKLQEKKSLYFGVRQIFVTHGTKGTAHIRTAMRDWISLKLREGFRVSLGVSALVQREGLGRETEKQGRMETGSG